MSDDAPPELAPRTDADWPPEIADMLPGFAGRLNVYRTMAHHPALLRAWSSLREHIVNHSALGRADLEVVILRTGHRIGSAYEWAQHVERARGHGLPDARILSIRGPLDGMTPADADLCAAVDELFETSRISERTLSRAVARFGKEAVFDLMATVGFYSTLGFMLNTCRTPLDDNIAARLRADPLEP